MSRTFSLAALSTLLLATAVEAYSGSTPDNAGYQTTVERMPRAATGLMASTDSTDAASVQGDNCGVEGYPWLSADGQLVES